MSDSQPLKQFVLDEIDEVSADLANGGGADQIKQGRGIAILLRVVRPMVERETVTEIECLERMSKCPARAIVTGGIETAGAAIVKLVEKSLPWVGLVAWLAWQLIKERASK